MKVYLWDGSTSREVETLLRTLTKTGFPCDERAWSLGDVFIGLCKTQKSSAKFADFVSNFLSDTSASAFRRRTLEEAKSHKGPVLVAYSPNWMRVYLLEGDDPFQLWRKFLALEGCSESIIEAGKAYEVTSLTEVSLSQS